MGRRKRHKVCPECGQNIEYGTRFCPCIPVYKRDALKAAEQLCYSREALANIRAAKTSSEISRIMVTERSKL